MSARRDEWVSLPTAWIEAGGLKKFKWASAGGHRVAALMVLMVFRPQGIFGDRKELEVDVR